MNKITRETILQLVRQAHMADQPRLSGALMEAAQFMDEYGRESDEDGNVIVVGNEDMQRLERSMLWDVEGVVS